MPNRWVVKDHMYRSTLRPLDRLVMHTLIARARTEDAVIPSEHQPSIRTLAHETGMGKHTLQRSLARLEHEGWVEVGRPTKVEQFAGASNAYAVTVPPASCTQPGPTPCTQCGPTRRPSVGTPVGPEQAQGWAQSGPLSTSPSPKMSPGSPAPVGDDPWTLQHQETELARVREERRLVADADEAARKFTCPYCDAAPGQNCYQRGRPWKVLAHTHDSRRKLARGERVA